MPPQTDPQLVEAELAQLPVGEAVGRDHLARMARIGAIEQFGAAACLFRQGEPALDIRVVVSGRVSLTLELPGQAPMIVAALSRGDMLGWSALQGWSSPTTWSASATASKATTCLRFPGAKLRELCEVDHELGFYVMRHAFDVVSRRLGDCRVQLLDIYGNG
jgi:CRP/FNR family transcriptional regulator, cyclic AMP receptor protein